MTAVLIDLTLRGLVDRKSVVVVVDGANVARQKDGRTRVTKLAAAIDFFRSNAAGIGRFPVKCVAFVPNFWLNAKPSATAGQREIDAIAPEEVELLRQLVDRDYVTLTPSQVRKCSFVGGDEEEKAQLCVFVCLVVVS